METAMLLLTAFLVLAVLLLLNLRASAPENLPPGPRGLPIIGNLLQVGRLPHVTLSRMARKHGQLFSLRLGSELAVVASSPAAAQEVLRTHDRALSGRHLVHCVRVEGYAEFSMVWSHECTKYWKNARKIFHMDLLGPRAMEAQTEIRERKVFEMVASLREREGEVVEIRELVFETLLNMIGSLVVSRDLVGSGKSNKNGFKAIFRRLVQLSGAICIEDYFPVLSKLDAFGRRRLAQRLRDQAFENWKELIAQRRAGSPPSSSSKQDFLDVLIKDGFSDAQINALLLDILVAGTDTSNLTVEWALTELIKNPGIMCKLQQELDREIGADTFSESLHPRLPYLQACVKETLRLHPAAPIIPRHALDTCTLMNYTIPKGCQVMVNVWAIGTDPGTWENPLIFEPERFMNPSLTDNQGQDFNFIPFGGGRRICPGMSLAAQAIPSILGSLIHNFDWSLPNGMHPCNIIMNEKFGLALEKDPPLLLTHKARR